MWNKAKEIKVSNLKLNDWYGVENRLDIQQGMVDLLPQTEKNIN